MAKDRENGIGFRKKLSIATIYLAYILVWIKHIFKLHLQEDLLFPAFPKPLDVTEQQCRTSYFMSYYEHIALVVFA